MTKKIIPDNYDFYEDARETFDPKRFKALANIMLLRASQDLMKYIKDLRLSLMKASVLSSGEIEAVEQALMALQDAAKRYREGG